MNANVNKVIRILVIILWAITLALLITGLIFLFAKFRDNELFTRVALSLAAMMSIFSTAFTIFAMIKNKEFSQFKRDEKQNLKYKLNQLNSQNKRLFEDTKALAEANQIEMMDIEFEECNSVELANNLNDILTLENSRILGEIATKSALK